MSQHEPAFNVHASVMWLLALMILVQVVRISLPEDWGTWLTLALAFIPARYSGFAELLPGGTIASVTSFVTHTLVHGDWMHLALNGAWLLAFGGAVARRVGTGRFLCFFVFCGVAGALAFLAFNPEAMVPMVGASGAISGLMGGTMRYLFTAVDGGGFSALRDDPRAAPLMPLGRALVDKRVVAVTLVFLLANILAAVGFGSVSESGIAWEAHIGGYFAGLLAFGFFDAPQTQPAEDPTILH